MIQIEVTGFQSIEQTQVCIDGFTALVGRSNIGKSAVVRALKCALTNSLGTSFVRHGEFCARTLRGAKTCKCFSSVHIQMDGFDLLWEKGDSVNRYLFNGKEYDKPGQGIPDFLVDSGFSPVKVGDDSGCIQVADQFFPIFLLNQSGPAIAEAISDVARLDRINKAAKMVEKDRREAMSTKKVREKDAVELRAKLQGYDGLDRAIEQTSSVEDQLAVVEAAEGKVDLLTGYQESVQTLTERIRGLVSVGSVVVPDLAPLVAADSKATKLTKFSVELDERVENYKAVAWVENFLSKVPEIEPVQEAQVKIKKLDGWIGKLRSFKERFAFLDRAEKTQVPALTDAPEAQKRLQTMDQYISKVRALETAITSLEGKLKVATDEEGQVVSEAEALGVCPTCTQPFQVGQSEHAHA